MNSWEERIIIEQINWQESEMKAFEENAFTKKVWLRKDRTKSKEIIKNHEFHSELNIEISLKK